MLDMRRRDFVSLLGGAAAAWPLAARAQPAVPVIGFLGGQSPRTFTHAVAAFRQGLREAGYVEGRNVSIEYRWAEGQRDRLPTLATELVRSQGVSVIAATGGQASGLAAKAATKTIPIVFTSGGDPVKAGLVASLSRPEGNITGISWFNVELGAKKLALLLDLVPSAETVALLINPNNPEAELQPADALGAARTLNRKLLVLNATSESEIDTAFATLVQQRAHALVIGGDPLFVSRRDQLITLSAHHAIPTISGYREFPAAGDLMSYGNSLPDAYRRAGNYTGAILKGATPADLPVDQATKFELVINVKTAKALGLEVPLSLLIRADELIE
jgi:putative tryptophan/tyrosine transport system substrate-binding protein